MASQPLIRSTTLLAVAAFYHPDEAFRVSLEKRLRAGLKVSGGSRLAGKIRASLAAQKGTALSPFYLSEKAMEVAVLLAEARFLSGSTRFRVTSEDHLGPLRDWKVSQASVVLTNRGNAYFSESRPAGWYPSFWAGRLYEQGPLASDLKRGRLGLGPEGVGLWMTSPRVDGCLWDVSDAIVEVGEGEKWRRLEYTQPDLKKKGGRVGKDDVIFQFNKEAEVIRLLAACERGDLLRVYPKKMETPSRLQFRLQYPEEAVDLETVFFAELEFNRWADFPLSCGLSLDREEQEMMGRWFAPHPEFTDIS